MYCNLPDHFCTVVGADPHGHLGKDGVVQYLQCFADKHELPVRTGFAVRSVCRSWDGWVVEAVAAVSGEAVWIKCDDVIMAVGGFHEAKIPAWAADLPADLMQLSAEAYKNPEALAGSRVLVVGSAQSGTQIAAELAEAGKSVTLCLGRHALRLPRTYRGLDSYWWLERMGLFDTFTSDLPAGDGEKKRAGILPNPSSAPGRDIRFRELANNYDLRYTGYATHVVDGKLVLREDVAAVMESIERFAENFKARVDTFVAENPELAADVAPPEAEPAIRIPSCETAPVTQLDLAEIDVVIFATGYRLRFDRLMDLVGFCDEHGYPYLDSACQSSVYPGLHFLGLP
jgi:putative flavoprotein involved in K+ transport